MQNNAGTEVLEQTGDGSRTALQLSQAEAARKFSLAMSQQKPRVRPMEAVWALIALLLFGAWFEAKSLPVEQAVAQERGCIAQFGPGEYHRNPKFQCAPMVEAPVTAMTRPIQ